MNKDLNNFNLRKEEDNLIRMKIKLDKSKLGCGQRFEYGNYINGALCEKDCLCDDCDREIERNETEFSTQETLILGVKIGKNTDIVDKIKQIINSDKNIEDIVKNINEVLE